MDFQATLDCLLEGKKVQRRNQHGITYELRAGNIWAATTTQDGRSVDVLMTKIDVEDILADDWVALV